MTPTAHRKARIAFHVLTAREEYNENILGARKKLPLGRDQGFENGLLNLAFRSYQPGEQLSSSRSRGSIQHSHHLHSRCNQEQTARTPATWLPLQFALAHSQTFVHRLRFLWQRHFTRKARFSAADFVRITES